jgi:hypothetical protein
MALTYQGKFSLCASRPPTKALSPLLLDAHGEAAIAIAASITGALNLNASLSITPPTLALTLQALIDFEASCTLALSLGLPTISFDFTAALDLVAHLNASLGLLVTLDALLAVPCAIGALGYVGPGTLLGAAVSAIPITATKALVIGAPDIPSLTPPAPDPTIASTQLKLFLNGLAFPGASLFTSLCDLTKVTCDSIAEGRASIEYQLGLALQLAGHITVSPPTFAASIDAMAKFAAALKADGLFALPKVNFALDASARIAATLQAQFSLLFNLGLAINRQDAQFFIYTWDGLGLPLGTALTAELATEWGGDPFTPSIAPCHAAVLATADPVSDGVIQAFFGGAF